MSGEKMLSEHSTANGWKIATWAMVVGAGLAMGTGDAEAAALSFDGQQIRVSEFLGDPEFATAEEVVVANDGVELEDFGFTDGGFFSFDIDIGASQIVLVSNQEIQQAPGTFGFFFADEADSIMRILTAGIASSEGFTGIAANTVSVTDDGNGIIVDFEDVGMIAGALMQIDVTFAQAPAGVVPLPATLPLALGGFAALAGLRRRRG